MAKITRSVIKEIVKECLVEILLEGIDSEPGEEALVEAVERQPRRSKRPDPMKDIQQRRDNLDKKRIDTRKPIVSENAIKGLTQNAVMTEIYADTAATTLAAQGLSNEAINQKYIPGDNAARAAYENDPRDLFDGANNWAALAFSSGKQK